MRCTLGSEGTRTLMRCSNWSGSRALSMRPSSMIYLPAPYGTHSPEGPEGAQLHVDRPALALLPQCSSLLGPARDPTRAPRVR